MRWKLLLCYLIVVALPAVGAPSSSSLSAVDQRIFDETFEICKSGTVLSALKVGFRPEPLMESLINWREIGNFDYQAFIRRFGNTGAGEAGGQSSSGIGLTPKLRQIRASEGFWRAMSVCYGYRDDQLNYGNLMKQLVDLGHLSSEVVAASAMGATTLAGIHYGQLLWQHFPLAGRFITSVRMSIRGAQLVSALRPLVFEPPPTAQEKAELKRLERAAFQKADESIEDVLVRAQARIDEIEKKLQSSALDPEQRDQLEQKLKSIQASVNEIRRLGQEELYR